MDNKLQTLLDIFDKKIKIEDVIGNYLTLDKKGSNFWAVCPFHQDTKPSLSVSPTKKIFKCFSCNASGNTISFIQRYKNLSFIEAIKLLSELYRIDYKSYINEVEKKYSEKQKLIFKINQDALDFFEFQIENEFEKNQKLKNYLLKRDLDLETIRKYKLGFNYQNKLVDFLSKKGYSQQELQEAKIIKNQQSNFQNRLIFPIIEEDRFVYGFSGRLIDDALIENQPKYFNSEENEVFKKTNILWNFNNLGYKEPSIILFEGFMDVISWETKSNTNIKALATMGVAFNQNIFARIKQRTNKLIIGFDKDKAGIFNTISIANIAISLGFNVEILHFNNFKDIDDVLKNEQKFNYLSYFIWFIDEYLLKIIDINNLLTYDHVPKKEINNFFKAFETINQLELVEKYFISKISLSSIFIQSKIKNIEHKPEPKSRKDILNWNSIEIKQANLKKAIDKKEILLIKILIELNIDINFNNLFEEISFKNEELLSYLEKFKNKQEEKDKLLQFLNEKNNIFENNLDISQDFVNDIKQDLLFLNKEYLKITLLLKKKRQNENEKYEIFHEKLKIL